mmetsp:Transcript_62815/g.147337  ORF Transcript_62815/g.147337 Transcript_62815/m.147337 type:complete len:706 (-) Transcript_62815:25-2142(-)
MVLPPGSPPVLLSLAAVLTLKLKTGQLTAAGKALLAALPLLALRFKRAVEKQKAALGRHPGTAEQRALCYNPALAREDFEQRFIGKAADLADRTYDFVVVGTGSAGCACAARLVKAGASVLLVEAGGEAHRSPLAQCPRKMWQMWQSEIDWCMRSTPQQHLEPKGRVVDLERGKTLGGSSTINYNMWVRGAPEDFDRWASDHGCEGWSFKDVLPHFRAIERMEGSPEFTVDPRYRGQAGPVAVAECYPSPTGVDNFLQACKNLGAKRGDYNTTDINNVSGPTQFNTHGGGRQDCFTSFIEPLLRWYPKLQVVSETFCRKVLLDKEAATPRAVGLELELRSGEVVTVRCSQEVVLCAGALMSPQLLMLSGVGEAAHLQSHGIDCVVDSPAVGQHLQDHPMVPMLVLGTEKAQELEPRGHVTNSSGLHAQWFWQSEVDKERSKRMQRPTGADIQTIFLHRLDPAVMGKVATTLAADLFQRWTPDLRSGYFWRPASDAMYWLVKQLKDYSSVGEAVGTMFSITTLNNHPDSRGTVRLQSADPHVPPLVDPNFLAEKTDVDALVEGYKRARQIAEQPSLKPYINTEVGLPMPDPNEPWEVLADFVRKKATSTWHYSCTTRMGPIGDKTCVCDPKARVQGVQGLRVADAGLMPFVVSGNTNAASVMIGDRVGYLIAAEFTKKDLKVVQDVPSGISVPLQPAAPMALKSSM